MKNGNARELKNGFTLLSNIIPPNASAFSFESPTDLHYSQTTM